MYIDCLQQELSQQYSTHNTVSQSSSSRWPPADSDSTWTTPNW